MCVYSMVVDHYRDKWTPLVPNTVPVPNPLSPQTQTIIFQPVPQITQAELDEFRQLLDRAREYDKTHNEPACELEEKKDAVRRLAELLGVDVSFL